MNHQSKKQRYVLVTQCFQNDFFLAEDCNLCLPEKEIRKVLLGKPDEEGLSSHKNDIEVINGMRKINPNSLKKSLLYTFLDKLTQESAKKKQDEPLYMINIRDYHKDSSNYDQERKIYGRHCKAQTKGVRYIEGLEKFLDPDQSTDDQEKILPKIIVSQSQGITIFHVHSNAIFDFLPDSNFEDASITSLSILEMVIKILNNGSKEDVDKLIKVFEYQNKDNKYKNIHEIYEQSCHVESHINLNLLVMGVYTDIKVQLFITHMKNNYQIANIAVSDSLTLSASLERHLAGLDYAQKVLGIEIVTGIKNALSFLGIETQIDKLVSDLELHSFTKYSKYFYDKQVVLNFQGQKLKEYIQLAEARGNKLYSTVEGASKFLIRFGIAFLSTTLLMSLLAVVPKELWHKMVGVEFEIKWQAPAVLGTIGLAQILSSFFGNPMSRMAKNFKDLVMVRMIFESHSLKLALSQFHLTTAEILKEGVQKKDVAGSLDTLKTQLDILKQIDDANFEAFDRLGFDEYHKFAHQVKDAPENADKKPEVIEEKTDQPPTS